jgi:hypothetical protein
MGYFDPPDDPYPWEQPGDYEAWLESQGADAPLATPPYDTLEEKNDVGWEDRQ